MEESFRQMLDKNPAYVNELNDHAWTALQREALAGNHNLVRVLIKYGANRETTTPDGCTALDLAKLIGWDDAVDALSA